MARFAPLVAAFALSISACSSAAPPMSDPTPPTVATPDPDAGSCNADAAKADAIGKTADAATVDRARSAAGAKVVRVIKPGMMVTMDYRGDRLNIDVDADNRITNLRCG